MAASSPPSPCGTGSAGSESKRSTSSREARGTEPEQNSIRWIEFPATGCNESFNSKLRDELLNGEIFHSLKEAEVLIERWRRHYNTVRPHSSLQYRPPAPETIMPRPVGPAYATVRRDQQDAAHGPNLPQTVNHL